jgi:DNA-binding transcriptional LysR family regulator
MAELRDFRWAIIASQHKSLRQAALALNTRQSTLSRRLRDLEHRLGAPLFERTNGGTRPTTAGRAFLESARRIVEETETAFRRHKTQCAGKSGRLTIGVYASLSTGNLRATLTEHQRRFPEVDVRMVDGGRERLLGDLAANTIDIAIMTAWGLGWSDRRLSLWSERVIVAMEAAYPLSARHVLRWPELANERFLLSQSGVGSELEQLLGAKLHSLGSQRLMHQDVGLDRLLSLVGAGRGVLLMLEGATGMHFDGVVYREIHDGDGPTRLNFMAYWREANSNPTLGPFLAMLRERYPDLSAECAPA